MMDDKIKMWLYYLAWAMGFLALAILIYGIITSF